MQSIYLKYFRWIIIQLIKIRIYAFMSLQFSQSLLNLSSNQVQTLNHLTEIRDLTFRQLISKLQENRLLLNQVLNSHFSFNVDFPSPQAKEDGETSDLQSEEFIELELQSQRKHFSTPKLAQKNDAKNDTKNIPKNYGKAILSYIQKSSRSKKLAASMGIRYSDFLMQVRRSKAKINSIEGLKRMWGYENLSHKIKKCIRILSYEFMRKHCLEYIFHSKVRNYKTHIKYRQKLIEGIENPGAFNNIKDY